MDDLAIFWDVNAIDPNNESGAAAIMTVIRKGLIFYMVSTCSCGSVALIIPIVFGSGKVLPFKVWIPDKDIFPYGFEV